MQKSNTNTSSAKIKVINTKKKCMGFRVNSPKSERTIKSKIEIVPVTKSRVINVSDLKFSDIVDIDNFSAVLNIK